MRYFDMCLTSIAREPFRQTINMVEVNGERCNTFIVYIYMDMLALTAAYIMNLNIMHYVSVTYQTALQTLRTLHECNELDLKFKKNRRKYTENPEVDFGSLLIRMLSDIRCRIDALEIHFIHSLIYHDSQ